MKIFNQIILTALFICVAQVPNTEAGGYADALNLLVMTNHNARVNGLLQSQSVTDEADETLSVSAQMKVESDGEDVCTALDTAKLDKEHSLEFDCDTHGVVAVEVVWVSEPQIVHAHGRPIVRGDVQIYVKVGGKDLLTATRTFGKLGVPGTGKKRDTYGQTVELEFEVPGGLSIVNLYITLTGVFKEEANTEKPSKPKIDKALTNAVKSALSTELSFLSEGFDYWIPHTYDMEVVEDYGPENKKLKVKVGMGIEGDESVRYFEECTLRALLIREYDRSGGTVRWRSKWLVKDINCD